MKINETDRQLCMEFPSFYLWVVSTPTRKRVKCYSCGKLHFVETEDAEMGELYNTAFQSPCGLIGKVRASSVFKSGLDGNGGWEYWFDAVYSKY